MNGIGEVTQSMLAVAENQPNSWLRVVDPFFDAADDVPSHGIVGWYWVSAQGQLAGEFHRNQQYLPSPLAMKFPQPHNRLEFLLQCAATGYTSAESFAHALASSRVLAHATANGGDISVFEDEQGRHYVLVFTSESAVPNATGSLPVEGRTLAMMSEQVAIRVDPGTPMSITVPAGNVPSTQQEATVASESRRAAEDDDSANSTAAPEPATPQWPQAKVSEPDQPGAHERFMGSMLAGALGDALGYAIEFWSIETIRSEHGESGLAEPVLRDGVAQVSDDTQMMLFTLDGLIRAHVARRIEPMDSDPGPEVQHAYQRWFHTQGQPWAQAAGPYGQHLRQPDGWLITNGALFASRAPGNTCMSALDGFARTHQHATFTNRINDSKGCGGVMRAAPVAVWSNDPAEVFHAAAATGALTHSHPSGYLAAGVLATIVHQLIRDVPIGEGVRLACELLRRWSGYEAQLRAIETAQALASRGRVTPEELAEELGGGWVGEEALAIGLYAVLATGSLPEALLLSVNHSGDSDSTGIVCGNIAGALYGTRALPAHWLGSLELHDIVSRLARDALAEFSPGPPTDASWTQRYPAW